MKIPALDCLQIETWCLSKQYSLGRLNWLSQCEYLHKLYRQQINWNKLDLLEKEEKGFGFIIDSGFIRYLRGDGGTLVT